VAVGRFAGHGLVEALHLPVGAGSVGPGGEMADAVGGEQFAEGAVLDVGEGVVGHQPGDADAAGGEVGEGARDEAGDGGGGLVVVALDECEAGVVIDDRVDVVVADPRLGPHPLA